jgi:Lsr2
VAGHTGAAAHLARPGWHAWYARSGSGTEHPWPRRYRALLIGDVDGTQADGTVRFGLDGTEYEIDLNAGQARALPEAPARYASAARRPGAVPGGPPAADAGWRAG